MVSLSFSSSFFSRRFALRVFHPFIAVIGGVTVSGTAWGQPLETIPYPTQLVAGQQNCLILHDGDRQRELTPQEEYAKENWTSIERLTWKKLCTEGNADLSQYFTVSNREILGKYCQEKSTDEKKSECQQHLLSSLNPRLDMILPEVEDATITLESFNQRNNSTLGLESRFTDFEEACKETIASENTEAQLEEAQRPKAQPEEIDECLAPVLAELARYRLPLSASFLRTILLREPFRSALPRKIVIKYAQFADDLDLSSSVINRELHLEHSEFNKNVKFEKTSLSQSLYFDHSIFHRTLTANNAVIQGSLFIRNANFNIDDYLDKLIEGRLGIETEEQIILNFRGIQVDSDIYLNSSKIVSSGKLDLEAKEHKPLVIPLALLTARVGNSIYLDQAKLDIANLCQENNSDQEKVLECKDIELTAVKVGDAVSIDSKTEFDGLNMTNAQMNTFLLKIKPEQGQQLRDLELLKHVKRGDRLFANGLQKLNSIFSRNIELQDAIANNFQVINDSVTNKKTNKKTGSASDSDIYLDSRIGGNQNEAKSPEASEDEFCELELDGFLYKNVNPIGFSVINLCLNHNYTLSKKHNFLTIIGRFLSSQPDVKDQESLQLFQPLEQAATISRELGVYPLERELLYRRKNLEVDVAVQNELWPESLSLQISDFAYGFGYKRLRIIRIFLGVWIIGVILAWKSLNKRQAELLTTTLRIRNQELKDEKIMDESECLGARCHGSAINIEELSPFIDSIQQVVFYGVIDSVPSANVQSGKQSSQGQLKPNVIEKRVIEKRPIHRLFVAFNEDFDLDKIRNLLNGRDRDSNQFKEQYKTIYFAVDLGDGSLFRSDKPVSSLTQMLQPNPNSDLHDTSGDQPQVMIKNLIERLEVRNPKHNVIGVCKNFFPHSGLWLIYSGSMSSGTEENALYSYDLVQKELHHLDSRFLWNKRAWRSALYSFDLLLPVIELDPELHGFIFDESEGFARFYFIFQKLIAAVIASILLPILLTTGL